MSTNTAPSDPEKEDPGPQQVQKTRRRRLRGACDKCRIKKIRCDSAEMAGKGCTNCRLSDVQCSHDLPHHHKKTEMQQAAYIQILEGRIKKLEECIQEMRRRGHVMPGLPPIQDGTSPPQAPQGPDATLSCLYVQHPRMQSIPLDTEITSATMADDSEIPEAEDLAHVALAEDLKKLSTNAGIADQFFGQASVFMLAKDVYTVRDSVTGDTIGPDSKFKQFRRLVYWDIRPWEVSFITSSEESYVYPEDDLLRNLVDLYFEKTNSLIPVLHRPTFMKSLCHGQHRWDPSFGMVVLMVCALGSRYSSDPRVKAPDDASGLSSGWKYFSQVPVHRKIMLVKANVYDLQYFCLAAQYLLGTSMPQASWNILGIGLRYALEQGAHRRKGQNQISSAENELRKRAFWAIVCLDRIGSSFLGRPCAFPHETFDVDYPIECDDEYWETDDPEQAFQQPAGKPCSITGFVCLIKLCEILGFVLRTLYSNKKSRLLAGFIGNDWEGRMVAALDSAMNEWKEALPDYLLWDPDRADSLFFHQSVNLHSTYYYVQMQMHRQFLTRKSSITFTSLAMCTHAARSCAHILEAGTTRGLRILPSTMIAAFTAGVLMVLAIFGGHCPDTEYISNPEEEKAIYNKCVNVLKECERRWHPAGQLCDILTEVGTMNQYLPMPNRKRRRHLFEAEFSAQVPTMPSIATSDQGSNVTKDTSSSMSTTDEGLPYDWDLQNLMLAEMGYVPDDTRESTQSYTNTNTTEHAYSTDSAPFNFSQGGEVFELWADLVAASSNIEDWDAYLATMGQPQT